MTTSITKLFCLFWLLVSTPIFAEVANKNMPFGEKAFEIYKTSVELRTAKGHNQVPVLANYLADELEKGGFDRKDIYVLPIEDTAALIVTYKGDGSLKKNQLASPPIWMLLMH